MPTYVVDGVRYKSDVPLNDAELDELSCLCTKTWTFSRDFIFLGRR